MPVYIHVYNLIINKKAIQEKYEGGLEQFRIDYKISQTLYNQEDDELFSIGRMNADELNLDKLISKGLSYDDTTHTSQDFTIIYRYGGSEWDVNWLEHDALFAWHIDTSEELKAKVDSIGKMYAEDIFKEMEKGNNLLRAFRKEDI